MKEQSKDLEFSLEVTRESQTEGLDALLFLRCVPNSSRNFKIINHSPICYSSLPVKTSEIIKRVGAKDITRASF